MATVTANGCETFYEVDDFTDPWRTDVETVWLQHGVGRSTRFWHHFVAPLAGDYRVIRRDLRGHGRSGDPGPDHVWSLDELVADMRDFMDAIGLESVHYLGESIGGILGILFATRHPERLKSLTICNSPTTIRPAGSKALSGGQRSAADVMRQEGSRGWAKVLLNQRVISGLDPAHTEWVLGEWAKTPAHVLTGIARTLNGADTAALFAGVSVPTLILAPANSPITPLEDQVAMRRGIPNARLAVIEGPGHEIYVDRPEECLTALTGFLASLR